MRILYAHRSFAERCFGVLEQSEAQSVSLPFHIEPDWHAVLGLAVAIASGPLIGRFLAHVRTQLSDVPLPTTDAKIAEQWQHFINVKTAGTEIGLVERPLFFAALWVQLYWLIPAWLVMKTAFYWQGANFAALPQEPPATPEAMAWQAAKRRYGTARVSLALIGTGANIVVAFLGVAAGKWIVW